MRKKKQSVLVEFAESKWIKKVRYLPQSIRMDAAYEGLSREKKISSLESYVGDL